MPMSWKANCLLLVPFFFVPSAARADEQMVFSPDVVSLERTGGFAGGFVKGVLTLKDKRLVIEGSRITTPISAALSENELEPVIKLLKTIPFKKLKTSYPCENCRDTFHYKLDVSNGAKNRSVSWDDRGMPPKELLAFEDEFSDLITNKSLPPKN
jgi:hypothetical protein